MCALTEAENTDTSLVREGFSKREQYKEISRVSSGRQLGFSQSGGGGTEGTACVKTQQQVSLVNLRK